VGEVSGGCCLAILTIAAAATIDRDCVRGALSRDPRATALLTVDILRAELDRAEPSSLRDPEGLMRVAARAGARLASHICRG